MYIIMLLIHHDHGCDLKPSELPRQSSYIVHSHKTRTFLPFCHKLFENAALGSILYARTRPVYTPPLMPKKAVYVVSSLGFETRPALVQLLLKLALCSFVNIRITITICVISIVSSPE